MQKHKLNLRCISLWLAVSSCVAVTLSACGAGVPDAANSPSPVPTLQHTSLPKPTATSAAPPEVIIEKGSQASRQAYNTALAKWHAAAIGEYEIKSHIYSEGGEQNWTLRVKGKDVTVVSSSEDPNPDTSNLDLLVVDDQFAAMARILAGNDDSGIEAEGAKFYITYVVIFDEQLGYPTHVEMRVNPGPVMDAGYVVEVESFTIAK